MFVLVLFFGVNQQLRGDRKLGADIVQPRGGRKHRKEVSKTSRSQIRRQLHTFETQRRRRDNKITGNKFVCDSCTRSSTKIPDSVTVTYVLTERTGVSGTMPS